MKRKVLAIAPLAVFLAWHPAQSRQTEGQNCRRVKSAATGMMTTQCDKPRSQPTTGGTLYYPGDTIPSPQQQTRIPPPADGGFQPPDLSRDPEYARSPAPASPLERFRGSITYSGSYFGRVTGPQNKNPGSFTYRGSGGNVRVPNPFDLAPKMNDVQGAILFELEFNNGQVTARYYPNGFIQAGSARGTYQNGQCILYDDVDGMPWSGTCDGSGFSGSTTMGPQSPGKGTINFQTSKTAMVDFVERDRIAAQQQRERQAADARLAAEEAKKPKPAPQASSSSRANAETPKPPSATIETASRGPVNDACLIVNVKITPASALYKEWNSGAGTYEQVYSDEKSSRNVEFKCSWPAGKKFVTVNLKLSRLYPIFGCIKSTAEPHSFTFTRSELKREIKSDYGVDCISTIDSVSFR